MSVQKKVLEILPLAEYNHCTCNFVLWNWEYHHKTGLGTHWTHCEANLSWNCINHLISLRFFSDWRATVTFWVSWIVSLESVSSSPGVFWLLRFPNSIVTLIKSRRSYWRRLKQRSPVSILGSILGSFHKGIWSPLFSSSRRGSVQFSSSVVSDSLQPHESQRTTPRFYSNSWPLSLWCHPAISSSVVPFSSCLQSIPASESFPMSQLFSWGGQRTGVSALTSVLPINIQDWSPLGWTGWISLQSKGLSRVFPNTTVQKHQFFGARLSSQSNSHIHTWPLEKP